jgi:hypothetical protein
VRLGFLLDQRATRAHPLGEMSGELFQVLWSAAKFSGITRIVSTSRRQQDPQFKDENGAKMRALRVDM